MKKVMLDVVFMEENKVGYAVLAVGFQSRKYLYVKVVTEGNPEKTYIRVKKSNAKVASADSLVELDTYREICVQYDEGLLDERLEVLEDKQKINEVEKIASWYTTEIERVCNSLR